VLRALIAALALLVLAPAAASAGTVGVDGSAIVYTGDDGVDAVSVFETVDAIHFGSIGSTALSVVDGTCTASSQGQSVVCPKAGATSVTLLLGGGDDLVAIRSVTLPLAIDCGTGQDIAISGAEGAGCERSEADPVRDGVRRPLDCDDGDPAIRPGARELRGNGVDENCDTRVEPFPPLLGSISVRWAKAGDATRNLRLQARRFLRGATIEVRCVGGGCPARTVRRTVRRSTENLQGVLGTRVLRRGARLEVRVTSPSRIGRMLRFRLGRPGQPDVDFLCLPPGGGTRAC
jgi:hypothetical protein